ncbi:hypothetical protein GYB59_00590 [bacterium]|nr:hypothetical protein [bacterium]
MQAEEFHKRFSHHPPKDEHTIKRHEKVRNSIRRCVSDLLTVVPKCREQSAMLTKLEEAMFWGNAAVAREITAAGEHPSA